MNYRDFFKNKKATAKDIQRLIPEGVDQKEFNQGIGTEKEHTNDEFVAAKIAGDHLKEDPHYYSKLSKAGLEEEEIDECGCEVEEPGNEYDDNGGLPTIGGALAVPHVGQPIMMGKIINVGGLSGTSASGEQSGMTTVGRGINKDKGGIRVQQTNDKEQITAGGKPVDSSLVSKTVGGQVVPGEGQKQGGPNSQGTIAATPQLSESKQKIRKIVKDVLKEIKYDKTSGRWVKINEEKVNMKMGASYKTVQPRQYKVMDDDTARTNQYEPEITEMYDEEEETKMNERYVELANEQRTLSSDELMEFISLREKIDNVSVVKRNNGLSQGGTEPNLYEDGERSDYDIASTETSPNDYKRCPGCGKQNYLCDCPSKHGEEGDFGHDGFSHTDTKDVDETVNMKMGPSYKTVQPRQYKVTGDDTARTNQYDPQVSEAGIGATQHSSYRTANHGNYKQDPKTRWADDLDEGVSKVAKTIAKGQKSKKSTFSQSLKHKKAKKTTSGVHKKKS